MERKQAAKAAAPELTKEEIEMMERLAGETPLNVIRYLYGSFQHPSLTAKVSWGIRRLCPIPVSDTNPAGSPRTRWLLWKISGIFSRRCR